ncbi:hypothetical protein [Gemmata massiliana]|nr:hypothetical protein [Gemmata massiliana]
MAGRSAAVAQQTHAVLQLGRPFGSPESAAMTDHLAEQEQRAQADLLRDIFGNPFRSAPFSRSWCSGTAVAIAERMYECRDFSAMPILADALQEAGCDGTDVLNHCRGSGPHARGCWVVDLVLGKK